MPNLSGKKIKLAHIINPVSVPPDSSLFVAQPLTFESMRVAQSLAASKGLSVSLYSSQFSEDRIAIPQGFISTEDLKKSVLDYRTFARSRKLPLIEDILNSLYLSSDADYFVYTNVDIILHPYFYLCVIKLIQSGIDALVINRRTINAGYSRVEDLPLIYTEVGRLHPGFDCFIFSKKVYPHFCLGKACIGIKYIGQILLLNLQLLSKRFQLFKHKHLTFHLGDERLWNQAKYCDYTEYNRRELLYVRQQLNRFLIKNE